MLELTSAWKKVSHTVNCSEYQLSWKYWCAHASSLPTSVIWKQQLYVLLPNNPLRLAWAGVQVRSSLSSEPIGCLLQNRSRIPASPDYSYIPDLVRASSRSRVPRLIINTDNPRDLWGIQHFWKDSCPGDEAVTARQLRPVRKLCISITPGRCKGSNCNMWGISSTSSLVFWVMEFYGSNSEVDKPTDILTISPCTGATELSQASGHACLVGVSWKARLPHRKLGNPGGNHGITTGSSWVFGWICLKTNSGMGESIENQGD